MQVYYKLAIYKPGNEPHQTWDLTALDLGSQPPEKEYISAL
jgi:hypothetical protein